MTSNLVICHLRYGSHGVVLKCERNVCAYLQQTYEPHQSAVYLNYAPGLFLLAMLLTSLMAMIHRLLLLSGDVEMNPGPLGQNNEGEHCMS